jgi:hypothetical protein
MNCEVCEEAFEEGDTLIEGRRILCPRCAGGLEALPAGAPGIEAESPQEPRRRFRGLGAESPVFAERKGARKE